MRARDFLLTTTFAAALLILPAAPPAHAQSALTGTVSSAEEGAMEGVVVSAKRDGSTITISVVTDAQGRFAFPGNGSSPASTRCARAPPAIQLRGTSHRERCRRPGSEGRSQARPSCAASRRISPMPSGCTSMPGTEQQKKFLLNCIGCHTLERIMKSSYDAEASCR